jgi:hypothetical protein
MERGFEKFDKKKIFWWRKKLSIGFPGLWLVGSTLAHVYVLGYKSLLE